MSFRIDMPRKFLVNAFKKQAQRELLDKYKKKGVLTKILQSNQKKSTALVDILRESDSFNTLSSYDRMKSSPSDASSSSSSSTATNEQFLKKFSSTVVGGPKFSIAQTRAHHLSNFLSDYMLNAFNEGLFDVIEVDDPKRTDAAASTRRRPQGEEEADETTSHNKTTSRSPQKFVFEISNVELLADMSAIQIYWLCSSDERINLSVEAVLDAKLRNQIRARLIQDRVINYVPRVVFCRDPTRVIAEKLDEYLVQIDREKKQQHEEHDDDQDDQNHEDQDQKNEPSITTMSLNSTTKTPSSSSSGSKSVNNLYGVDVNKLIELIRKDGQSSVWKPAAAAAASSGDSNKSEHLPKAENSLSTTTTTTTTAVSLQQQQQQLNDEAANNSKFKASLKAFEINKRLRAEKIKKSTLARLARIEFENSGRDAAADDHHHHHNHHHEEDMR